MGKSVTLAAEAARVAKESADGVTTSIHIDLRAFSNEVLLCKRVFESPEFIQWEAGNSRLFLHLDSLDEALMRIDTIANLLAAELPNYPTDRLSLRIACRTAVWPDSALEPALHEIWGEEAVGVFELAPLRRVDVISAAEAVQVNADDFIEALRNADAVPFAIKPLTLDLLLTQFKRQGSLPRSISELYASGCLSLCEEQSPSRRGAQRFGTLSPPQRLRLASRLAAVTMLANRYAVWTGPDTGNIPDEDVPLSDLCIGHEEGDFQPFDVTENHIREVLDTGLFSARGVNRMGWAHQSYAEFLAARYLKESNVSPQNILKMLMHPAGGLVPQLSAVTAWTASLVKSVRDQLIEHEPLVLLRGDLENWSDDDLAALTASLLGAYEKKNVSDFIIGIGKHYTKLAYPDLAAQLRPYIVDTTKNIVARRNALTIAEVCALRELQPEILQVALNVSDDPVVRGRAVSALATCGDDTIPAQVLPLAKGELGPDPYDDIKGQALEIVWPSYITSDELFSIIAHPNEGYVGSYVMFLTKKLLEALKVSDLKPAIAWATNFIRSVGYSGDFQRKSLADSIMMFAWKHFEETELTEPFIDHVLALMHQFGDLLRGTDHSEQTAFREEMKSDVNRRRAFMVAVCKRNFSQIEAFQFVRQGFLNRSDFEWLLSISPGGENSQSGIDEQTLCGLIQALFDHENTTHFEALYDIGMRWEPLRRAYSAYFDGVEIDSAAAQRERATLQLMRELENQRPPTLIPPPAERVQACLDKFEDGDLNAWWILNSELSLTPTSTHYWSHIDYSIVKLPGWENADEVTRQRILDAAEVYLANAKPQTKSWLGTGRFFNSDLAAYRALRLLKHMRPATYERLPPEVWRKWAAVAVALLWETSVNEAEIHLEIVKRASANAPEKVAKTVRKLIRTEREKAKLAAHESGTPSPSPFFFLHSVEQCWDNQTLRSEVLSELEAVDNTPEQFGALLAPLLKAGGAAARERALSVLEETNNDRRPYALSAAEELVTHSASHTWANVWRRVTRDDEFGIDLFLRLAHHHVFRSTFHVALTETELGQLYVWIEQRFPRGNEPETLSGQAHWVGPHESVSHLRDEVLRYLVNLGTVDAVQALRRAVGLLPAITWLPYQLNTAEQVMRMRTWVPLTPMEVLRVAYMRDGQLVQTPEDLCQLIVEALRQYEHELHGEQTPVRQIWDRQADDSWQPVEENALSDHVVSYLRRYLEQSGIILNREVQINCAPGAPMGDRTDIKIDAVRKLKNSNGFDSITAIIETKGCWHSKLFIALKEQLYEQYLVPLSAPIGVYLVGWFDKPKWNPKDSRKRKAPNMAIAEAQSRLNDQAASLPEGFEVRAVVIDCHL